MSNQDYGWRDMILSVTAAATGGGTPSLVAFGPTGGIKQLSFGVGDSVYMAGHINHDYKPESTAYPHVHWSTDGTNIQPVKWQFTCLVAMGHDQANFGTDVVIPIEEAAAGTAWRHMITEDATGFDLMEPDTAWIIELKRITNGATENTDTVFALFADVHYEVQQHATMNRTPDFYS